LDDEAKLAEVLNRCEGAFQCDCRGVGTDWFTKQLQSIARKLLGTASLIASPSEMEADFYDTINNAMERSVGNVRLRVWTPKSAKVISVKQMLPEILPLTDRAKPIDNQTTDYPTGAWAQESRDYYFAVELPPGEVGEEMLAAKIKVVYEEGQQLRESATSRIL